MKLFISSDIEGTTGITSWDETEWTDPRSGYFKEQMTREVASACEGAILAGYDEIWVKDAHDSGRNINPRDLPENVKILRGWIGDTHNMMGGINLAAEGFEAVAMTGYHSGAANEGNPLSHTMNTDVAFITINGITASEFLINSYTASYYNVPVCFLSGDKSLCIEAKKFIPNITTVATNEGFGNAVLSINPRLAERLIKEGVKSALEADVTKCMLKLPDSFTIDVTYKRHTIATSRLCYTGVEKINSVSIRFFTSDWMEALKFFNFCL